MGDTMLKAGMSLRVRINDNYPVREFYGRKSFVISTTSSLGGRNDFLGYGYLTVGCCSLLFGFGFLWRHIVKPPPIFFERPLVVRSALTPVQASERVQRVPLPPLVQVPCPLWEAQS